MPTDLRKTIEEKLDVLANSDSISEVLLPEYKGEKDNCFSCPIANYLEKHIEYSDRSSIEVHGKTVDIYGIEETSITIEEVKLPNRLASFIANYDDGKYDHLCTNN